MKKIAVFDIDGTIFRSSLLVEMTEALIQEKLFPVEAGAEYRVAYKNWLDRKGPYKTYLAGAVEAFQTHMNGVDHESFLRVARKVVKFHRHRVYRFTRDLVRSLHRKGYFIIAISNSPKELVNEFCATFGFDLSYGRIYKIDKQGKMRGEVMRVDLAKNKGHILKRVVSAHRLSLEESVGVGDTESDIAFLKLVAHPIAFNPNAELYAHAQRAGWRVVVERKDVIYDLSQKD